MLVFIFLKASLAFILEESFSVNLNCNVADALFACNSEMFHVYPVSVVVTVSVSPLLTTLKSKYFNISSENSSFTTIFDNALFNEFTTLSVSILLTMYVFPIVDSPFSSKDCLDILSNIETTYIPLLFISFTFFIASVASVKIIMLLELLLSLEKEFAALSILSSTVSPSLTSKLFIVCTIAFLSVLCVIFTLLLSATLILIPGTLSHSNSARFVAFAITFFSGSLIPVLLDVSTNIVTSFDAATSVLFFKLTS